MSTARVPAALARLVRYRAGERCEYCRLPQAFQEALFHIDHVRPRVKGGPTTLANLALACVTCSLRKAARTKALDPQSRLRVRLYHPRRDRWTDHFAWTGSWRVRGKTAPGRATVRALAMNRPAIVALRKSLAAHEIWPAD